MAVLAGCGTASTAPPRATPTATRPAVTPTSTATAAPTAPPAPTAVIVTDLGAFRQQVAGAITGGDLAQVRALIGPDFSFQGATSVAALMPQAAQRLQEALDAGKPWGQADWALGYKTCYMGGTPRNQVMGFVGNNGHYLMVGIANPPGQSYWVVTWAFDNPQGPYDGCI